MSGPDVCEHFVSMADHCSDCVGFNPFTCSPACDWCGETDCGFCIRQGALVSRVQAVEAAEDRAEQAAYEVARERGQ